MKKNKIIVGGITLLLLLGGVFQFRVSIKNWLLDLINPSLPVAVDYTPALNKKILAENTPAKQPVNQNVNSTVNKKEVPPEKTETPPEEKILPVKYNLAVPFTMQAPYSDWAEPWQNACEEAAVLMVHYYYQNKTFTKEIAKEELLKLVDWQDKNFGSYVDTSIKQTAEMVEKNWGYKTKIIDNPTVEQIKKFIAEGLPVIVPTAGRELNNPYFVQPGPIYHMFVIKGYTTDNKFITNDPGIGRGHDYLYSTATIMSAMHDWNGSEENILQGAKRILIIYPE